MATKPRLLVVTGGHAYETSFYGLFEGFAWKHAVTNTEAFKSDIRRRTDVLMLYGMESGMTDRAKQNFQNFAESGKGLVVLHHAICGYNSWPWYKELVGGKYQRAKDGDMPQSTFKHDQELVARPLSRHPDYFRDAGVSHD